MRIAVIGLLLGVASSTGFTFIASAQAKEVIGREQFIASCQKITLSEAGKGRAFNGDIANEDYSFSAKVPVGFTGWDGVGEDAPFHGFSIFFDDQPRACIHFEIHTRVAEQDAPRHAHAAKSIRLGDAQAWQSIQISKIANTGMANVRTSFSFWHVDHMADGEVILIAPTSGTEARRIYDAFIATLMFHK